MSYPNSGTDPVLIGGGQDTLVICFSLWFPQKLLFLCYIETFYEFPFLPKSPGSFPDGAESEQRVRLWVSWGGKLLLVDVFLGALCHGLVGGQHPRG